MNDLKLVRWSSGYWKSYNTNTEFKQKFGNNGVKVGVNVENDVFWKKGEVMKGYKAFNSNLTCRGFQYKIGETYTLEDPDNLEICKSGFHFCPTISDCYKYYSPKDTTRICEVEALGEIQKSSTGNKMATNKIKIIREITGPEKRGNLTEQEGYCNTGNCNSGNYNSGNYNSGDYNIGDWNTGDRNVGSYNSGYRNSGNRNSGDYNTGDWNSGYRNSGNYNSGNYNSGCFNTNDNPTIMMFNKPSDWTMRDWIRSDARAIMLDLFRDKENKQSRWDNLSEKDKAAVMSLPNFDADIFEECTGIRV